MYSLWYTDPVSLAGGQGVLQPAGPSQMSGPSGKRGLIHMVLARQGNRSLEAGLAIGDREDLYRTLDAAFPYL